MELTVYIYSKYNILRRCSEVFINTYFHNTFSKIIFKEMKSDKESVYESSVNQNINTVLKNSFKALRTLHESLKLKEKHTVWLLYIDSFDFDETKGGTIILLNNNVIDSKAICHMFKGKLNCINEKKHDLGKSNILNENLKRLFKKNQNFIRY